MKKISSKELSDLSVDQKLDMIMHALGIVSEPGVFVPSSVIDGHKLAVAGLSADRVCWGKKGLSEDVYAKVQEQIFGKKIKDADADSRLDAAMDAVYKLATRSSRVIILTGKDIRESLESFLEEFKDDPEAVAEINKAFGKVFS